MSFYGEDLGVVKGAGGVKTAGVLLCGIRKKVAIRTGLGIGSPV